ncbi:retinoschisin-like [Anneissia japonica]|uniref:retinoschisin-like n=1 Tax=Anneissia japonica TaxID=1529436 RepID=UPI0014258156|nr:retinoschisin-like [Anneissia japonica]
MMQTGWIEPRSTNISISFYRHMYGVQVGHLRVLVQVCDGVTSSSKHVWESSGNTGNDWLKTDACVILGNSPRRFKLQFVAIRGIGDMGDIAIDTLEVKDSPALEESCYNGLGIENGVIQGSALTASSSFGIKYGPQYSRLNSLAESRSKGGWSAGKLDIHQWIQVDLGEIYIVTGLAVQVRYDTMQWVSTYAVEYKLDLISGWEYITDEHNTKVIFCGYTANADKRAVRAHFTKPIRARFIRVHPLTWHLYISLYIHLYICSVFR